jgi:hypothetical protein
MGCVCVHCPISQEFLPLQIHLQILILYQSISHFQVYPIYLKLLGPLSQLLYQFILKILKCKKHEGVKLIRYANQQRFDKFLSVQVCFRATPSPPAP